MAHEDAVLEAARTADTEALLGTRPDRRERPGRGGTVWVSADGTMAHDRATGTGFAERFTVLCTRLGVFEADRICFVSDGAAAIRWIREHAFPTAIELLDWYHLVEALRRAIGEGRPDRLGRARSTQPHRVMRSACSSTRRPDRISSA